MRTLAAWILAFLAVAVPPALPRPALAQQSVAVELVLAVDVSGSVDQVEYAIQIEGIAAAFRDPDVLEALATAGANGIAVCMILWSSHEHQRVSVPWTHVSDAATAGGFADRVQAVRREISGNTAIGSMLAWAARLFDGNGYDGGRRVIDVSGDGTSNDGIDTKSMRDFLVSQGITINGLAIGESEPGVFEYYREWVIGGPAAFLVRARGFFEFPQAIKRKLLNEIRGPAISAPAVADPSVGRLASDR